MAGEANIYTIGRLAEAAGVPTSTVRYYERRGLMQPESRSPHNYRRYGKAAVARLRFIRAAQASGFALEDIARLLALRDGTANDEACEDVQEVIERRLEAVRTELTRLRQIEDVLSRAREACGGCSPAAGCEVLDELEQPSPERKDSGHGCRPCGGSSK